MSTDHCIEIGATFGRWTVIGPEKPASIRRWMCLCECGEIRAVRKEKLLDGTSQSCGCLQRENLTTHGMTASAVRRKSSEYWIWNTMIQRCTNRRARNYADYGGRGISVCERWLSFPNFFADMGLRPSNLHSLERMDNASGYSPANCCWATRREQNQNRRNNRRFTVQGETKCLAEWARALGCSHTTILARIRMGWTEERAVSTPVHRVPAN
jgi:hypothetical protein